MPLFVLFCLFHMTEIFSLTFSPASLTNMIYVSFVSDNILSDELYSHVTGSLSNRFKCNNFCELIDELVCAAWYQLAAFLPDFFRARLPHAKCQMLPNEDWFWSVSRRYLFLSIAFLTLSRPLFSHLSSFFLLFLLVWLSVCRESKCVGKSDDLVNCTRQEGEGCPTHPPWTTDPPPPDILFKQECLWVKQDLIHLVMYIFYQYFPNKELPVS